MAAVDTQKLEKITLIRNFYLNILKKLRIGFTTKLALSFQVKNCDLKSIKIIREKSLLKDALVI